jgi:hypothetical protein
MQKEQKMFSERNFNCECVVCKRGLKGEGEIIKGDNKK